MIYLLTRTERTGYDEYDAKVVRANSEEQARNIANLRVGDEGQMWTDKTKVVCQIIKPNGKEGEILGSFNAG